MNNIFDAQIADYIAAYQNVVLPATEKPVTERAISDNEQAVFTEAAKAWANYSNSPEGQSQLLAFKSMDLAAARLSVATIPDNPAFQNLRGLLDSLDLPASSFSIGLNFEIEIIVGFAGTLGFAIGVGDSKGVQTSEFLSLWIVEGIVAGALVGVQFGLWDSAPADLGGYSWGTEADAGLEIEASAGVFYSASGGLIGATLTIGAGVDEGIAEVESYTFILDDQGSDTYLKPVYQAPKSNLLIIQSLQCVHPTNDGTGDENEVYFIFQADGGTKYPYPTYDYFSMKEGDNWQCGRSVWFDSYVNVTVYDSDDTSSDDEVGTFSLNLNNLQFNVLKTFNSTTDFSSWDDTVEYTIKVIWVAQNVQS